MYFDRIYFDKSKSCSKCNRFDLKKMFSKKKNVVMFLSQRNLIVYIGQLTILLSAIQTATKYISAKVRAAGKGSI
jgi:hypothetical protein